MRPDASQQRIKNVISRLRYIKIVSEITSEALRDELNKNFLHKDDAVTVHAVNSWIRNEGATYPNGENTLAILEWLAQNENHKQT